MEKLRKQIKESFFNPILHFLPLIIFLIVDDFYGMSVAWKISFPVTLVLLVYVYFAYNRIFTWHLIFTVIYLLVSLLANFEMFLPVSLVNRELVYEVVLISFLLIFILFRKPIQKIFRKFISSLIPMSNNFEELYRVIWVFFFVLLFYIAGFLIIQIIDKDAVVYEHLLQAIYVGVVIFMVFFEMLRVQIVRAKLLREEWWPIVNDQGKIIGSVQHLTSLNDETKYMHPIVRVLIIDKAMILMQKRSPESLVSPGMWDTVISNHVKMGETIEQCVDRTAAERYSLSNFKYMYLSNYTIETHNESHYAFLFVSCQQTELKLNMTFADQLKWWTVQQIDQDLQTGIFSDNFKVEYDLLKRSGLLETGKCECNCRLKEAIYQQSTNVLRD